ncbi:mnt isoform X3 [Haematobia irritans]|uniref:mnt isoform X3 n=1 Tax=Haematobia irritans TaxID=7368 RepID=UPI003F500D55
MSEGLKTLLEAAQYIEQQEKLKLSPQATAIPAILNEHPSQRFIVHAFDTAAASSLTNGAHLNGNNAISINGSSHSTNNNNSINIRNSNIRHGSGGTLQVSSSAPAAAATFQHVNGHHTNNNSSSNSSHPHVTTTVLSNGTNSATSNGHSHHPHLLSSQLIHANHHDYEFNGNGGLTVAATTATGPMNGGGAGSPPPSSVAATSLNGRSSEGRMSEDENTKISFTTNTTSYLLVSHTGTKNTLSRENITSDSCGGTIAQQSHSPSQQYEQSEEVEMLVVDDDDEDEGQNISSRKAPIATKISLIERSNDGEIENAASGGGTAITRQHLLLSNGVRIVNVQSHPGLGGGIQKTISIPINGTSTHMSNIIAAVPYAATTQQQLLSTSNGGGPIVGRHKQFTPLTPPPMASRKFVEPSQYRIRSFSLSSQKISANHPMHVQNPNGNNTSGSNSSSSMMVDDIPPTQQQQHTGGYSTSSNSQHSPPRQGGGNHYMHMMNAASSQQAGSAGGNPHVSHVTPRRRTISSTSNGAGTREVHNKLEKNRRAHLKECYEALKNQLSLKDEDRRKTSNLAILGEALRCVQSYQKQNQELEAKWEHLANDKINLQKRIVSLKRELGPKYEQIFSGIFPDIEIGSIPSERDTINDVHSLSSGRGSTLYSSSSSLSSGGSNGSNSNGSSNAMSSPVGAGLQTAMPTAISPVITKINNNNNSSNNSSTTSPISISNNNNFILQHQRKHPTTTTTISTTIQAVAIPTQVVAGLGGGNHIGVAGGANSPTSGSPNTLVTFGGGGGGNTMPLSLTAKNISATAITRGSPTPSTPSPSPSSSSGVSSSSSLISSSPPINGVISNGRNVTVNIPNGLKLQAAAVNGVTGSVIGNGATSAAATIIATSAPAQGVNNTNNAAVLTNSQTQLNGGRKKTLSLSNNTNTLHGTSNAMAKLQQYNHRQQTPHHKQTLNHQHHHHQQQLSAEDGEQPAKFLKVLNDKGATTNIAGGGGVGCVGGIISSGLHEGIATNFLNGNGQKMIISNNFVEEEEEEQEAGDNTTKGKTSITNGSVPVATSILSASELCRLPGGAELNILSSTPTNGIKTGSGSTTLATAFYHANGKITLVNGLPPSTTGHVTSSADNALVPSSTVGSKGTTVSNGLMLKDAPNSSTLLIANGTSELNTSPATNINGLHFRGNFAQLLAAANSTSNNNLQQVASNNGTVASSKNYGFHMATTSNLANLSAVDASKTKISPKQTIVAWRPGATTTN